MYSIKADNVKLKSVDTAKELRRILTLLLRTGIREIKITKI